MQSATSDDNAETGKHLIEDVERLAQDSQSKLEQAALDMKQACERSGMRLSTVTILPSPRVLGYRCKCSFQVIRSEKEENRFQFAIRKDKQVVPIEHFPEANPRIQHAMQDTLQVLAAFPALHSNLSSVNFSSSWNDSHGSLLVTFNYDQPILAEDDWKREAVKACEQLDWTQLTGRSRKRILRARSGEIVTFLEDTIWLEQRHDDQSWRVHLSPQQQRPDLTPVQYSKPEGAFFHPNASVMCQALGWLLTRIASIRSSRLLELYCGAGAHTMALAKSGLLEEILAVEYDERLVEACRANINLNQVPSVVGIVSQDAAVFSQRHDKMYQVLLVDPPKQGLVGAVCDMIMRSESLKHILYISCGRAALIRDYGILSAEYDIVDCTLLDLFPGTNAVESLVHMVRR